MDLPVSSFVLTYRHRQVYYECDSVCMKQNEVFFLCPLVLATSIFRLIGYTPYETGFMSQVHEVIAEDVICNMNLE